MTPETRGISLGWVSAAAIALGLVAIGAFATFWITKRAPEPASATSMSSDRGGSAAAAGSPGEVRITLTPEMVSRAGIEVEPVSTTAASGQLRLPAVVAPNAYHEVVVTSLVPGRITSVQAALGNRVARGQPLAQVFSPDLADAQTAFAAKRAEIEATAAQLKRTERLVEIGAASRQQLELLRAEHARHTAELESARARLTLLGVPVGGPEPIDHASARSVTSAVRSPVAGIVTARTANVGLNVDMSMPLFTVVDLSTVWVEGDLYEKDFAAVQVGSMATITMPAYPGTTIEGKVGYIDPQVRPETRTAKVRVEVPNRDGRLKLGMLADISIRTNSGGVMLSVPRSALQIVDDRQVVYVADPQNPGQFLEREVQTGDATADRVVITAGLREGDSVVIKGTFFLRAQRAQNTPAIPSSEPPRQAAQTARVEVTEKGFEPATVDVKAGVTTRLTFVRRTDKTCAKEIVIPSRKEKRILPLNTEVVVEFTPAAGTIDFACGMDMLKGTIVVQ